VVRTATATFFNFFLPMKKLSVSVLKKNILRCVRKIALRGDSKELGDVTNKYNDYGSSAIEG